jgi:hypothetical protein
MQSAFIGSGLKGSEVKKQPAVVIRQIDNRWQAGRLGSWDAKLFSNLSAL